MGEFRPPGGDGEAARFRSDLLRDVAGEGEHHAHRLVPEVAVRPNMHGQPPSITAMPRCRPESAAESGTSGNPLEAKNPALAGLSEGGRYLARTSDPHVVELVLSQLS